MLWPKRGSIEMHDVHFNALDLNLLRVLDALLEERSATRAGERLGLSQSAVSHALNRLRYALKDELFVRSPDGLEPTPRAAQIGPQPRHGLMQLQLAVMDTEFSPATTDRQFVIACSDYACAAIVPGLMARLRDRAPVPTCAWCRARSAWPRRSSPAGSTSRSARSATSRTASRPRICSRNAGLGAQRRQSRGRQPMTLERLAELPHLIIALTGEDARAVDGVLVRPRPGMARHPRRCRRVPGRAAARGLRRRIGLTVPHVLAAPRIVARSDMAALIPRRLAVAYAERYRLRLFEPPYPSPPYA